MRLIQVQVAGGCTGVKGLTSSTLGTPARNPARQACSEGFSNVQTDGLDVVGQGGTASQMKHGYIWASDIAERDVCHIQRHLKGVQAILVQAAQNDGPLGCNRRAAGEKQKRCSGPNFQGELFICSILDDAHLEKQLALLSTALADTRVPPQTWLPFFWRLAIHGHAPAAAEFPFKRRELSGALPQKTCCLPVVGAWVAGARLKM